ncbi:hypothetical protein MIZ01_2321 [Sideroxyarcus emersonii]|uniref:Uncharacterized protein n=1 Tax=Sideroxyarcus emersonii TaxID=2764705 RepID=A0AAN1XCA6_9PROT|nr:hypothetical protein [Sideroxyarcus emersonii]BCK88517.1 hypothetical protein MIZ01_2321 [Sideroxyarcus emersonii]
MKKLSVPQPFSSESFSSRFLTARAMAFTLAPAESELEGCSGHRDSYEHFGPGPFVNLRDDKGSEMICRTSGVARMTLNEWANKLT